MDYLEYCDEDPDPDCYLEGSCQAQIIKKLIILKLLSADAENVSIL